MVPVFLWRGVSISALVRQAQLEQSYCQEHIQELYDGNDQQPLFVPQCTQQVERNVIRDGHWLLEIWQSVLQ